MMRKEISPNIEIVSSKEKFVIFKHRKIRYSLKGPINQIIPKEQAINARLELTNQDLIIKPKDTKLDLIKIPIGEIESFNRLKIYIKPTKFEENQLEILTKDKRKFYIFFERITVTKKSKNGIFYQRGVNVYDDLSLQFWEHLVQLIDYPKIKDEKEKQKELFRKIEKFFIEMPSKIKISELAALKCPSCKAPLQYLPPCECEHCGVLIELKRQI